VVADEDLRPELVRDTPSPLSDLLETRAYILSRPAAVGQTKHTRVRSYTVTPMRFVRVVGDHVIRFVSVTEMPPEGRLSTWQRHL